MSEIPKPTEAQEQAIERFVQAVIRWGMTLPAILFLESVKPLNYVGSQVMVVLGPIISIVYPVTDYEKLAEFFENRESIEYVIRKIEKKEAERKAS